MRAANLGLRFLLELAMLAAVADWGWEKQGVALAVVLPVAFAAVWGAFLSPKAKVRLAAGPKLGLELAVFAVAAAALFESGPTALAVAFAAALVVNEALLSLWRQR